MGHFIGFDWSDPLVLLRLYLAVIWGISTLYGARLLFIVPRSSSHWPLIAYSTAAGFLGAVSYSLGAMTMFHSLTGFFWVAVLLTFTPVALVLWMSLANIRADHEEGRDES